MRTILYSGAATHGCRLAALNRLGGVAAVVVGEAAEFWCNVPARLAMHRPQPFQKPVNVVVVEDAGKRQLGGRIVVCHAAYVARPMRAIKPKPPGRGVMPT